MLQPIYPSPANLMLMRPATVAWVQVLHLHDCARLVLLSGQIRRRTGENGRNQQRKVHGDVFSSYNMIVNASQVQKGEKELVVVPYGKESHVKQS